MLTRIAASLKKLPSWVKCGCLALTAILMWDCLLWSAITAVPVYLAGKSYAHRHFPARYTTPLETSIVAHLCSVLGLDSADERCQGYEVYAVEFFADIRRHYGRGTSRERVDEGIGEYLVGCDEWVLESSDCLGCFQRCTYDFRGDGEYLLTFRFNVHDPSCYNGSYDGGCLIPGDSDGQVWEYR